MISYGRFGTAYSKQSIHEGPIGCPETSVRNDHCLLRNDPEERSSYRLFQLLLRLLRGRALVASRGQFSGITVVYRLLRTNRMAVV